MSKYSWRQLDLSNLTFYYNLPTLCTASNWFFSNVISTTGCSAVTLGLYMACMHAQHMEDNLECAERKMWWKHDHNHTFHHVKGVSKNVQTVSNSGLFNGDKWQLLSWSRFPTMSDAVPMPYHQTLHSILYVFILCYILGLVTSTI